MIAALDLGLLALMTKATLTILPPLLVWMRGGLKAGIVAIFLYAALLSPWIVRNAMLLHAFVPFTTSATWNLWHGNNDYDAADETRVARVLADVPEIQRSRMYLAMAADNIAQHPIWFLRRCAVRFGQFWNPLPNAPEYRSGLFPWVSGLSFGPVLLLALGAVWTYRGRWRELLPIYALIGYFTLVHVLTLASIRYRLPIEPYLIVLASGAFKRA